MAVRSVEAATEKFLPTMLRKKQRVNPRLAREAIVDQEAETDLWSETKTTKV